MSTQVGWNKSHKPYMERLGFAPKVLTELVQETMDLISEDAAQMMVDTVENTRSGLNPSKGNRVSSGHMRNTIDYKTRNQAEAHIVSEIGWLDARQRFNEDKYILFQETGDSKYVPTPKSFWKKYSDIPPMHALNEIALWVTLEARREFPGLGKMVAKVVVGR